MDIKSLLPDFKAIGKTDWSKPQIKKDKRSIIILVAVALMVILPFCSWFSIHVTQGKTVADGSMLGVQSWYGILGLIMGLIALVGVLYDHKELIFWAGILAAVFGLIGGTVWPDLNIEVSYNGVRQYERIFNESEASKLITASIKHGSHEVGRSIPMFFAVVSLVATILTYKNLKNK